MNNEKFKRLKSLTSSTLLGLGLPLAFIDEQIDMAYCTKEKSIEDYKDKLEILRKVKEENNKES